MQNSFRDTNIAFANELSMLCDKFDINVWELISLANRHPRVNILQPGAGVGGHCRSMVYCTCRWGNGKDDKNSKRSEYI